MIVPHAAYHNLRSLQLDSIVAAATLPNSFHYLQISKRRYVCVFVCVRMKEFERHSSLLTLLLMCNISGPEVLNPITLRSPQSKPF